jgi:hypothetical protein
LANATTMEEANAVLNRYLPKYNARFARTPKDSQAAWRPSPSTKELLRICAFSVPKSVHNNNTVVYKGRTIDLPAAAGNTSYRGTVVDLRHLLNDQVQVYAENRLLVSVGIATPVHAPPSPRVAQKPAGRRSAGQKRQTFKQIVNKYRTAQPPA